MLTSEDKSIMFAEYGNDIDEMESIKKLYKSDAKTVCPNCRKVTLEKDLEQSNFKFYKDIPPEFDNLCPHCGEVIELLDEIETFEEWYNRF